MKKKDAWKVQMKTAEGIHTIKVCPSCTTVLENAKDNIQTWLKEL
jgi:hypothetical protein